MRVLRYQGGTLVVEGPPLDLDGQPRSNYPAHLYHAVKQRLEELGEPYLDHVASGMPRVRVSSNIQLRKYQREALQAWREAGRRGVVVLPTGAGKTVLAVKALEEEGCSALVVVPTLVLVEQWRRALEEAFQVSVGAITGEERTLGAITVTTYNSARLRCGELGGRFQMLVLDEVHHLSAQGNQMMARCFAAPLRLGLTATPPEGDALEAIRTLVGPKVYELEPSHLAGTHLADYQVKTVRLSLKPQEREEYQRLMKIYRGFLTRRNIRIRGPRDFLALVRRSGRDPEARRALQARREAMDIALNSESKVEYVKRVLEAHRGEKVLVFTRENPLVYRLSRELLVPAITHLTSRDERNEILDRFHQGTYKCIVTSRVLDEGVDVPDASLAIILSGSGSPRQFIQRLGRVLRKKAGKTATLLEVVSEGTGEEYISRRRRRRR